MASLISGTVGWWGFPWGIIFTIASLINNVMGGQEITREIMASLVGDARAAE